MTHHQPPTPPEPASGVPTALTEAERAEGVLLGLMNDGDRRLWFTEQAVERIVAARSSTATGDTEWPPKACERCGHRHGGLCVVEAAAGVTAGDDLRDRVAAVAADIANPRVQRPGMQRRRQWADRLYDALAASPAPVVSRPEATVWCCGNTGPTRPAHADCPEQDYAHAPHALPTGEEA